MIKLHHFSIIANHINISDHRSLYLYTLYLYLNDDDNHIGVFAFNLTDDEHKHGSLYSYTTREHNVNIYSIEIIT